MASVPHDSRCTALASLSLHTQLAWASWRSPGQGPQTQLTCQRETVSKEGTCTSSAVAGRSTCCAARDRTVAESRWTCWRTGPPGTQDTWTSWHLRHSWCGGPPHYEGSTRNTCRSERSWQRRPPGRYRSQGSGTGRQQTTNNRQQTHRQQTQQTNNPVSASAH
jgi:hypothetical protein